MNDDENYVALQIQLDDIWQWRLHYWVYHFLSGL